MYICHIYIFSLAFALMAPFLVSRCSWVEVHFTRGNILDSRTRLYFPFYFLSSGKSNGLLDHYSTLYDHYTACQTHPTKLTLTIEIVPYNSFGIARFEYIKSNPTHDLTAPLSSDTSPLLPAKFVSIEHVGSTSVPGCWANRKSISSSSSQTLLTST